MSVDKKLAELEQLAKAIEAEKSFDKTLDLFNKAAVLVQELSQAGGAAKGRITEIIKTTDGMLERELKLGDNDDEE